MGLIYCIKVSVLGKIGKINIERRGKLIERLRGRHTKKAGDIKNLHSSKPNISLLFQLDLLTDVRELLQILFLRSSWSARQEMKLIKYFRPKYK